MVYIVITSIIYYHLYTLERSVLMKMNITKNFSDCIYPAAVAHKAANSGFRSTDSTVYNAIWGEDVPNDVELAGGCVPGVAYIFKVAQSGKYVPLRVTFSRATIANFERGRKKFAHLDPETEI